MNMTFGRKLLQSTAATALMALAASSANAGTFTFTQTGFNDGASITGFFKAQDLNHDGKITGNEVWDLIATVNGGLYSGFTFEISQRYRPWIIYNLGSGVLGNRPDDVLDVFAPQQIGWSSNGSGGMIYDGFNQYPSSHTSQYVQVSEPTAVPEPESWAMLGAGLALLAAFARRNKRA